MRGKKIARHNAVVESDLHNIHHAVQMTADTYRLQVAFCFQVDVILPDKGDCFGSERTMSQILYFDSRNDCR